MCYYFLGVKIMEFALVLIVFCFIALASSVRIVPQGYEWTVETLGKYTRTLSPGLNITVPIIEKIGAKVSRMEQVLDVPSQDVITKDNATAISVITYLICYIHQDLSAFHMQFANYPHKIYLILLPLHFLKIGHYHIQISHFLL